MFEATFVKKKLSYLYVNHRIEGCAPLTVGEMMSPGRTGSGIVNDGLRMGG